MADLHGIVPRLQEAYLRQLLEEFPVVILTGARQTGKTTLVQSPGIGADRSYRSMDDFAALDLAHRDPEALVMGPGRITIDEIQRAPQLLSAIKTDVDRNRAPGRFLCTGSANLLLMKQVSESLAGRAVYLEIPPLTWSELERSFLGPMIEAAVTAGSAKELLARRPGVSKRVGAGTGHHAMPLVESVLRGGFPPAVLTPKAPARGRWFEGYIATYLERDLRLLSAIDDLVAFRRFMQAAALRNSTLLNVAQLAQDAGIPPSTASRYLSLLEVSYMIWRLPAFTINRGKRLAKAARLLWVDSGLAAHIAGFQETRDLAESRYWGAWLQGWVGHHLRTWASMRAPRPVLSGWRTAAGQEVDFVVETARSLLPIEVKATARPTGSDIRGLEGFLSLHREAKLGIFACTCREVQALSSRVVAVPLETLLLG